MHSSLARSLSQRFQAPLSGTNISSAKQLEVMGVEGVRGFLVWGVFVLVVTVRTSDSGSSRAAVERRRHGVPNFFRHVEHAELRVSVAHVELEPQADLGASETDGDVYNEEARQQDEPSYHQDSSYPALLLPSRGAQGSVTPI